jgi:hypothetical protein
MAKLVAWWVETSWLDSRELISLLKGYFALRGEGSLSAPTIVRFHEH